MPRPLPQRSQKSRESIKSLDSRIQAKMLLPNPESRIPNPESRIPNPESRIPNPESRIPNPESRIPNPESRIPYSHFARLNRRYSTRHDSATPPTRIG